MTIVPVPSPLRVAIVGAGPGGLAATIQFLRLPDIELQVFEGARELREVGAGIQIQPNTWRLLDDLKASHHLEPHYSATRDSSVLEGQQRNGATGELLSERFQDASIPGPPSIRIERYKLQNALLKEVPQGLIQLSKRLQTIEESADGSTLFFQDGTSAGPFDLVIGADGIRSVVRSHIYPDHKLSYTGKIAYRTIVPYSLVSHIDGIPAAPTFWHTPKIHVYTSPIPGDKFEIATRAIEGEENGAKVQWGQTASRDEVVPHYSGFNKTIRDIIAAPSTWLSFAIHGGPRLTRVVHNNRIALLGDASHPLSGAFGAGAAFAFEDAYVLSQAVQFAREKGLGLGWALEIYDEVRGPHYEGLYNVLDSGAAVAKEIRAADPPLSDDEIVRRTVTAGFGGKQTGWIYAHDVTKTWAEKVRVEEEKLEAMK